jgi:hypothetical protein
MAIVAAMASTVTLIVILLPMIMSFGWFIVHLRHLIAVIVYP